jgi:hypothetical protein
MWPLFLAGRVDDWGKRGETRGVMTTTTLSFSAGLFAAIIIR